MSSLPAILHKISYMALPLIFAIVLHEFAHGWVANKLGDPTARLQGRLTLNPLAHIEPFGTVIFPLICMILPGSFILGWAKPVPVTPARLGNPRRDMALVAAAGPGMNFVLAVLSVVALGAFFLIDPSLKEYWASETGTSQREDLLGMILLPLAVMAFYSVGINSVLMAINLIPIPPLDGGRVLTSLLPVSAAIALSRLEPYGMFVLVGLLVLDPHIHVISTIVGTAVSIAISFAVYVLP